MRELFYGPIADVRTPKLAVAVEALTQDKWITALGVIGLDAQNVVHVFNKTEAECSGLKERTALGRFRFVDVAPCLNNSFFEGRIDKARRKARSTSGFPSSRFQRQRRELTIRAQSGKDGGSWIFIQRA